jgi:type 2 lantibiotic biosynthesis protein LanM
LPLPDPAVDRPAALLDVVAKCATLAERLCSEHFAPLAEQDSKVLADRESRWEESAANGDAARFATLLATQGLDPRTARDCLRDVCVRDPLHQPPWADAFLQLLDGADFDARREAPPTGGSPDRYSFGGAFVPFASVAERVLDLMLRDHPVPFGAAARQQVVDYLVARWVMASQAALTLECRLRWEVQSVIGDPWELPLGSAAEWVELLGHHPLLLRLIGTAYQHWNATVAQLLARLGADREELARLAGGRVPGQVTGCELGAGDSHLGGRTVAILTFNDDYKVVYKPRDVRPEAVFNAYVRRTNQLAGDLPLRAYDVLVRGEYGWVEFVPASPTREVSSASAFYQRVGRLLRLLQLLGGHDLHWQNAVLSDEQLVILDLEGLLATPPTHQSAGSGAAALRHLRDSPLATWILPPVWSFGPYGTRPLDNSVLTAGGTGLTATTRLGAQVDDGGLPSLIASRLQQQISSRQPVVDGCTRSPHEHAQDILRGYRDMNRLICAHGSELCVTEGLAEMTVRFVQRNTAFYAGFLQMSLSPAYLQSGVDRDLCLHRLFLACHDPVDHSALIVRAEVQALRDLDIPYCRHPTDRDCLILDDGTEVAGYLEKVPLSLLDARWSGFSGEELEEQLDFVRSSLDASTGGSINRCWDRSGPLSGSADGWIESAVAMGDLILAQAREEEDGAVSFLGLHYLVLYDVSEVAVLRSDLLSGVGGLAIVLADLFTATGEGRFRDAAVRLAGTIHAALAKTVDGLAVSCRRARSRREPLLCGGLVGLGSLLYSLRRCRTVLGDGVLPEPTVTAQDVATLAGLVPEDLVGGLAGLLLALLAEPLGAGSLEAAQQCGETLLEMRRRGEGRAASLYPPGAMLLGGVPDINTGVAFALLRLGSVTGATPAGVSPADFTGAAVTPGNLLVRLRARGWSGDTQVGTLVQSHLEALDRASPSLDLMDGLELALEGMRALDDSRFRSHALRITVELQRRHRETNSWFPDRLAADRHCLSAITGIGALAHTLVRLDAAGRTRSLRLLD